MRKLKINRSDFALAFESGSDEVTGYLDSETGEIVYIEAYPDSQLDTLLNGEDSPETILEKLKHDPNLSDDERSHLINQVRIETDASNCYLIIPHQNSRNGYQDMQDFIRTLKDEHLSALLQMAIQGSGAFRRFKDVLYRHPDTQKDWYKFRDECEQQRMLDWLKSEGITPEFEER